MNLALLFIIYDDSTQLNKGYTNYAKYYRNHMKLSFFNPNQIMIFIFKKLKTYQNNSCHAIANQKSLMKCL